MAGKHNLLCFCLPLAATMTWVAVFLMNAIPKSWLVEQVSLEAVESRLKRHAVHPGWQRVKRLAQSGDEFWSFRSPPATWPKKVGAAGYALVRKGVPVASFTIMRS